MKRTFQSYLITGDENSRKIQTQKLVKSLGVNLDKVSPDVSIIAPSKLSISIDQVRDLKKHIFQKPVSLKIKFVIIENAQKLTLTAQNALLKILEEPPSHAVIVLEAPNKSTLLETIISRVITISAPPKKQLPASSSPLLTEKNILKLLEETAQIEDPIKWLDDQILILHNMLQEKISSNRQVHSSAQISDLAQIRNLIEKCAQTKQMIDANVNPRFALANLVFSLKLTTNPTNQPSTPQVPT